MIKSVPLAVQSAYSDLFERHKSRRIVSIEGTFKRLEKNGRVYWYAQRKTRSGRDVRTYIGPDGPETKRLIATARKERQTDKEFRTGASILVRQLRAAGLPSLDRRTGSVLNALARIGAFRLGATLIGTHAFRQYAAELGAFLPGVSEPTEDIDIGQFARLSLAVDDEVKPELGKEFGKLKLEPVPSTQKGRSWKWQSPDKSATVEFLTPRFGAEEELIELPALGTYAIGLNFLNFLLKEPIAAVGLYREGVLVQIPDPARYGIHKLIVATRRQKSDLIKARKDLGQAAALLEILLEDRPFEVEALWDEAVQHGPTWRDALKKGAARLPKPIRDRMKELEIA